MAELKLSGQVQRGGFRLQVPDMVLPAEGVTVLFGPSGVGKSTLLDAVAGLIPAPALHLCHGDQDWRGMPPPQRGIGMVRQQEPLFAHLTVAQNLRFPLQFVPARLFHFDEVVRLLGLAEWLVRYPQQLSGGQRQRVALGRALLRQPAWLFLDEPLSALDDPARREILGLLEQVKRDYAVPMLLVTHRVDEVERLADHVAFVDHGEVAPPVSVWQAVRTAGSRLFATAEPVSLLQGRVLNPANADGLSEVQIGQQRLLAQPLSLPPGAVCRIRIPASQVMLAQAPVAGVSALNQLALQVESVTVQAHQVVVSLAVADGQVLLATVTRRTFEAFAIKPHQRLWALIKAVSIL